MRDKIQLELERPIAFFPQLARALGGIEEAIFIQQLYYWSDKGKDKEGWIYKTKNEWEEETAITVKIQNRIIRNLKNQKIISTVLKKANGNPTLHYKLDIPMLQKVINQCYQREETNVTKGKKRKSPETHSQYEKTDNFEPPESTTETTHFAAVAAEEFSLDNELEKMKASKRKDIRLIGYYFHRKKPNIPSKLVFKKEMGRALAEAKTLKDYASDKVKQAMDYAEINYPLWTLQTIGKIITNIN